MKPIYFISVILVCLCMLGATIIAGANILYYLDYTSLLLVILPPLFMILASFSFNDMTNVFRAAGSRKPKKKSDLKNALDFFKALQSYIFISAGIAFLIGFIAILSNLRSSDMIAEGISVALLCMLYALFLNLVFIIPFKTSVKKNLNLIEE